jgi:hypothetical protein
MTKFELDMKSRKHHKIDSMTDLDNLITPKNADQFNHKIPILKQNKHIKNNASQEFSMKIKNY